MMQIEALADVTSVQVINCLDFLRTSKINNDNSFL